MSELVQKLAQGSHKVIVSTLPDKPVEDLKQCIDRDYVRIKFTETQGGTELGVRLDREKTDLSQADFDAGTGQVHLAGNLVLDYVKVRCVADVDIEKMEGTGRLEILEDDSGASPAG